MNLRGRIRLNTRRRKHPPKRVTVGRKERENAKEAALSRLGRMFPDLYAMILDEERVARGLYPLSPLDANDHQRIVAETLDFHEVYDALRSSGVTDGP